MADVKESIMSQIVLGEIGGKNNAIHAYDKMIWTVRSGFLTLLFAAWGLLLSSMAKGLSEEAVGDPRHIFLLQYALLAVSCALAIAGFMIDRNYVRRKFRVIVALNGLLGVMVQSGESAVTDRSVIITKLQPFLSVAGDANSKDFLNASGYRGERLVSRVIYTAPLIGVAVAVAVLRCAM